jgi:hypothetical protein
MEMGVGRMGTAGRAVRKLIVVLAASFAFEASGQPGGTPAELVGTGVYCARCHASTAESDLEGLGERARAELAENKHLKAVREGSGVYSALPPEERGADRRAARCGRPPVDGRRRSPRRGRRGRDLRGPDRAGGRGGAAGRGRALRSAPPSVCPRSRAARLRGRRDAAGRGRPPARDPGGRWRRGGGRGEQTADLLRRRGHRVERRRGTLGERADRHHAEGPDEARRLRAGRGVSLRHGEGRGGHDPERRLALRTEAARRG